MKALFSPNKKSAKKEFTTLIIRSSKYDEEGYVVRFWKGVLPSNTLGVLNALARKAFADRVLGPDTRTRVVQLDDMVMDIDVKKLARKYLGPNKRAAVCLAGVQSNQFCRAADMARGFKKAGFEVLIGGFHVSGSIAMSDEMPPECQALMDDGVTLVKGEVEECFGDILRDAYEGRLKPLYDIVEKPELDKSPPAYYDNHYLKHFAIKRMACIDSSRGCPFGCSFCTVINVQGRKMRCRTAETVVGQIEENYRERGITYYFFTDDNFARNKNWREILEAMIEIREKKDIKVSFMLQIDTKAWKIPGFVEMVARAGGAQVFIGIESLNAESLKAANKGQNSVEDFKGMVDAWHEAGIMCHGGFIIGFPEDTPESVMRDVETLKTIGLDQCSFFMMTPLPGSADHMRWKKEGAWLDPDYNNYDSAHEAMRLPNFAPGEWEKTMWNAYRSFFSIEHMTHNLQNTAPDVYWKVFKAYMWYRSAMFEGVHPMLSGLWRMRHRTDRRAGSKIQNPVAHFLRRCGDTARTMRNYTSLFFELQEVWLRSRKRVTDTPPDGALSDFRSRVEAGVSSARQSIGNRASAMAQSFSNGREQAMDWFQSNAGEASARMKAKLDRIRLSPKAINRGPFMRWLSTRIVAMNQWGRRPFIRSRGFLNSYWRQLAQWVRQGRVLRVFIETPRIVVNFMRDVRLSMTFFVYFYNELVCE